MSTGLVDLVRDAGRRLPDHPDPASVTALRIWHCPYRSFAGIERFDRLRTLVVATRPDDTLEALTSRPQLQHLSITHLPTVTSLAPLAALTVLETLRLHTLPSYASGRTTTVESLEPVAALPALRHLELFGVVPEAGSLDPLLPSTSLASVRVHGYPRAVRERCAAAPGFSDDWAPAPGTADWA